MRRLRYLALAAFGLTAACSTTPLPTYYLLPAPEVTRTIPYTGGVIAVREIEMPLYARLQQFASLTESGSVDLSEDDRWADEPARASTRALASALKQITGASIVSEPWADNVKPAIRLDVTVDRFIGDLTGGTLALDGQYRILRSGEGNGDQTTFSYRIPIGAPGYRPLADAHSRAISALAEDIAARIEQGGV